MKKTLEKSSEQKAQQLMPISFHSCLYGLLFDVYFGQLPAQSTVLLKRFQSLPCSESFDRLSYSKARSEAPPSHPHGGAVYPARQLRAVSASLSNLSQTSVTGKP